MKFPPTWSIGRDVFGFIPWNIDGFQIFNKGTTPGYSWSILFYIILFHTRSVHKKKKKDFKTMRITYIIIIIILYTLKVNCEALGETKLFIYIYKIILYYKWDFLKQK